MEPIPRIHELRTLLNQADFDYFIEAQPTMTDSEYDQLIEELVSLETQHPDQFDSTSPSQRVGGQPTDGFQTVQHNVPMQSIDNTYTVEDLRTWYKRMTSAVGVEVACTCDPKIDGVAISLRYEDGVLATAVTRGDGERGDDVTVQVRTIRSVPLRLTGAFPQVLEVRGEVFMPNTSFDAINARREEQGEQLFANARNATSGTLKSLDPRVVAERKLAFLAHGKGEILSDELPETWSAFVVMLRSLGIPVSDRLAICSNYHDIEEVVTTFADQRHALGFGVDGMVVRVDSFTIQDELGSTSKSPRWCIAYKYPAQQGETKLIQVDWQVGKNGTLTPRATMDPIFLAGTTVKHATLHNIQEIHRKDIRVGDTVVVEKAGEIIPQVVGVQLSLRDGSQVPIEAPTRCPQCHGSVELEGPKLYCVNPECPAQFSEKVKWFAGRNQMDIDGLGDRVVDQLIHAELVHHFSDLYKLTIDDVEPLEGFAVKSATSLIEAIHASKTRGLARVLASVGIRLIGRATAKNIASAFPSLQLLQDATVDDFKVLQDFGEITALALHNALHSEQGIELFQRLASVGVVLEVIETGSRDLSLAGKTIVITGTIQGWDRKELTEELEKLGAKVTGSVSSNTDIVIAGENAGSKLAKARDLAVEIWDEKRLLAALSK